jgi:hypothetical protein
MTPATAAEGTYIMPESPDRRAHRLRHWFVNSAIGSLRAAEGALSRARVYCPPDQQESISSVIAGMENMRLALSQTLKEPHE